MFTLSKKMILIFISCLFVIGCSLSPTRPVSPDTLGEIMLIAQTEGIVTDTPLWTAQISFTRGHHALIETLPLHDYNLTTTANIPIGTWDITLQLINEDGIAHYQDRVTDITIYPDKPSSVEFQLRPADGVVNVDIDLSNYPQAEYINRVRVHFDDDVKEIIREDSTEPLSGQYHLAPRSYDFKVELFTESFRATDRIDPGFWKTIDIAPLDELFLTWIPAMEDLQIIAEIFVVAQPPTNLQGQIHEDTLSLSWDPSPTDDIFGYQIFWQPSSFEPFVQLSVVDHNTLEYSHEISALFETDPPQTLNICVVAYNHIGLGYRSQTITLFSP